MRTVQKSRIPHHAKTPKNRGLLRDGRRRNGRRQRVDSGRLWGGNELRFPGADGSSREPDVRFSPLYLFLPRLTPRRQPARARGSRRGFSKSEDSFAFANCKRARFQKRWFAAIDQIISQRKASPTKAGHRDLLDLLLILRDAETGEGLSSAEIRDQCATMFFAGSETTARLMFWTSYLLAMDPEEQTSVRKEIIAFPPERISGLDDLQNWQRLRNALLEALRLYPPVPHIVRDANGPDDICGEKIEADTQVYMSPWVIHRHRRFWDWPTAFLPGRFAGKTAPWTTPAYIPFGSGPRICIGLSFATDRTS